jgi:hypothetical protein
MTISINFIAGEFLGINLLASFLYFKLAFWLSDGVVRQVLISFQPGAVNHILFIANGYKLISVDFLGGGFPEKLLCI